MKQKNKLTYYLRAKSLILLITNLNTLNQRIKSQIKLELDLLLEDVNVNRSKSKEDTTDHRLIENLNNEILFLRSELLNKNKIIEMLITNTGHNFGIEKQSTTLKANDLNQIKTYDGTRNKDNKIKEGDLNLNLFPTKNRFDSLNDETNDINITQNIPMKRSDELNVSVKSCTKSNLNICVIGDSMIKEIKPYKMHQAFK